MESVLDLFKVKGPGSRFSENYSLLISLVLSGETEDSVLPTSRSVHSIILRMASDYHFQSKQIPQLEY
jgi:hypothetical protein